MSVALYNNKNGEITKDSSTLLLEGKYANVQEKWTGVTVLIPDNINFDMKSTKKDEEGC